MRQTMLLFWGSILGVASPLLHAAAGSEAPADWPFGAGSQVFSTPVTGDLDGDGVLEVVFTSMWDGRLYVVDAAGNLRWRRPLYEPGREPTSDNPESVVLVDVDDDPRTLEIVASSGYALWGRLYVLDAHGNELATFDTVGDVKVPPTVLDTDGDGTLEVYFGLGYLPSYQRVDLQKFGAQIVPTAVWSTPLPLAEGGILTPAAAADLFGDGTTQLVVSTADEHLYALDPADGSLHWMTAGLGTHGYAAPVAVDLDGDGRVEVLQVGGALQAFEGRSGELRWSFDPSSTFGASAIHTPVAFDFDGDGSMETVLAAATSGLPDDWLILLSSDGGVVWSTPVQGLDFGFSAPAVGDIDHDGAYEIVVGTGVASPAGSAVLAFDGQGALLWTSPQPGVVYASPSLTDLDGDGLLETLFGNYAFEVGALDHRGRTFSAPLAATGASAPWPSIHRNANNNRVH